MTKDDIRRYIEYEAPGLGVVDNLVSEVVCYRHECDGRVEVDPDTLVVEDASGVSVTARDPADQNIYQVEIYCCRECRNLVYSPEATHD